MGFLDLFDNPNLLTSLLGPDTASALQPPPSAPPPGTMNPAANFSPNTGGMLTPPTGGPPPPAASFDDRFPMAGDAPAPAAIADARDALRTTGTQRGVEAGAIPMPRPRPPDLAAGGAPGGPDPALPPPITVPPTAGDPGAPGGPGSLAPAFGLPPSPAQGVMRSRLAALMDPRANAIQAGMAGLGKGLSAVGKLPFGSTKGGSFAAGAGGALEGGAAEQQHQTANQRAAVNDLFNASSTAFKDVLAADAAGDRHAHTMAAVQWLTARAQAQAAGKGVSAAQTPEGRLATAELRVLSFDSARRKGIDAAVRSGLMDPDTAKQQYDDLDKKTEAYRQRVYKGMSIKPDEAKDLKTKGTEANPYDARTMSGEDFHLRVPLGAHYINEKGEKVQRVKPPPGAAEPPPSSYGESLTDQMALSPPAA